MLVGSLELLPEVVHLLQVPDSRSLHAAAVLCLKRPVTAAETSVLLQAERANPDTILTAIGRLLVISELLKFGDERSLRAAALLVLGRDLSSFEIESLMMFAPGTSSQVVLRALVGLGELDIQTLPEESYLQTLDGTTPLPSL